MTEPIAVDVPGKPAFSRSTPTVPTAAPAISTASVMPKLPEAARPTAPPVASETGSPAPAPTGGLLAGLAPKHLKIGATAIISIVAGIGAIRLVFPPKAETPPATRETAAKEKEKREPLTATKRDEAPTKPVASADIPPVPEVHRDISTVPPPGDTIPKTPLPMDSTPPTPLPIPVPTTVAAPLSPPTLIPDSPRHESDIAKPSPFPTTPIGPSATPVSPVQTSTPPAAYPDVKPAIPDPNVLPVGAVNPTTPPASAPTLPPAVGAPALPPVTPDATPPAKPPLPALPEPMGVGATPIPVPPAREPVNVLPKTPDPVLPTIPTSPAPKLGENVPVTPVPSPTGGGSPVAPKPLVPEPASPPPSSLPMIDLTPKAEVKPPALTPPTPKPTGTPLTITKPAGTAEVKPTVPETLPRTTFDVDLHSPTAGDSYESISKEFYNDTRYGTALKAFNRNQPLQGGHSVEVPPLHVLKRKFPNLYGGVVPAGNTTPPLTSGPNWKPARDPATTRSPASRGVFTVPAGGMTLQEVARQLGTSWRDLWDLNPQHSPSTLIPAGTELKMPVARP